MGSNTTTTPTTTIQKSLGLTADNIYGPKTTAAVQQFQTAKGLKADGIFGPITEQAFNNQFNGGAGAPASNLVTTSGPARNTFAQNSSDLSAALSKFGAPVVDPSTYKDPTVDVAKPKVDTTLGTASDPFLKELDTMSANANVSTQNVINNIKATKMQSEEAVNKQFNDYKAGLQLLGIQTGKAAYTPDLLNGQIQDATNQQQAKITQLNRDEATAMMDAETARDNNDFQTLQTKMDYLDKVRTEKTQALKDYNDLITTKTQQMQEAGDATAKVVAPEIFDTLQTLDDADKEDFILAIAKQFNIPAASLATALATQQTSQDKEDNTLLSPTEAATLGVPYGTTQAQAASKGITPDRYKPTAVTPSATAKQEIQQGQDLLNSGTINGQKIGNPRGDDKYVDPGVYLALYKTFKGTANNFIKDFPLTNVNPKSYNLLPDELKALLPKDDSDTPLFPTTP